ncbi:MAG: iron chelate uptake ABC transporter family permease subunit [Canidatus Methanoxibalbensis ujae]|nr:iron chelate uptake ABC transporter family permease subunit [Candidatus Methanoxibalbensis ujae]MCW7079410.1 iron chelate uptake ABC transporter family permease subunit [Candidatus Methanoxibalbensis ujae]
MKMKEDNAVEELMNRFAHWRFLIFQLTLILVISVFISVTVGTSLSPVDVLRIIGNELHIVSYDYPRSEHIILFQIRIPRAVMGVFIGAALSAAGVVMQSIFKNPMADPYIIGTASGASVGAVFSFFIPISSYITPLFAFIGAISATLLVYNIARTGGRVPVDMLLLTGIAVSIFLNAILSFMMYMVGHDLGYIFMWLMGRVDEPPWENVLIVAAAVCACITPLFMFTRDLNALLIGEETAQTLGISVESVKKTLLFLSALLTASAVAFTGTIGFVGLIIPHITRIFVGADHRILLPASALMGGIFLVWADMLVRFLSSVLPYGEMPIGVITSFFGAPFFIYLLQKNRKPAI